VKARIRLAEGSKGAREMRSRFVGVLAVGLTLTMVGAACAKKGVTPGGSPTGGETTSAAATSPGESPSVAESPTPPQLTLLKEGTLTVGSCLEYKPFEFRNKDGDLTGFDVEIMEEIAKRLGLSGVTWVKANFNTIFPALATGQKFDAVAAASTITPEREQIVDFSDGYYNSRQSLTVNTDKTPDITSTDDLGSGDSVGVQKGTTGKEWAEKNLGSKGVQVRTYTTITDAFTDLEAGRTTGIINDEPSSIAEVADRPSLKVVEPIDTGELYGIAVNPENPDLKDAINQALHDLIADGTYKELFEKYFPTLPLPPEFAPTS
jgi:polar amino acid transport system substrate-binding protein